MNRLSGQIITTLKDMFELKKYLKEYVKDHAESRITITNLTDYLDEEILKNMNDILHYEGL